MFNGVDAPLGNALPASRPDIVERLCDELTAPLAILDLSGFSLEEGLGIFARTLLNTLLKERPLALYRLLIGESARLPSLGRIWSTRGPETSYGILAEFLSTHCWAGQPWILTPYRAAVLFHNMVLNNFLTRAIFGIGGLPGPKDVDNLVNEAVWVFVHGYRP